MIDISAEQLLTLPQAARVRPHGRLGRPTHPSTVYRWISRGARGGAGVVRLEGVRIGGSWYTSREALQRFADRLTEKAATTPAPANANGSGAAKIADEALVKPGY